MTNDNTHQKNKTDDTRKSCVFWLKTLSAVLTLNIIVLVLFTAIVSGKLNEAIELAKPQEGTLTLVTSGQCPLCRDFSPQKQAITAQNVDILEDRTVASDEGEGAALIGKYGIKKLPAIVFETKERINVPLQQAFKQNGRMVGDTAFVWEQESPPYFDVDSTETKGLVDVILLSDGKCGECSEADLLVQLILNRMGIVSGSKTTVDISDKEGRKLVEKYEITKVPAIVLSPEAREYAALASAWRRVGSIEDDGSFVFRKPEALRLTYRDLETRKILGGAAK